MIPKSLFSLLVIAALFLGVANPAAVFAEEGKNAASAPTKEAPAKTAALDETLNKIELQKATIKSQEKRRDENTGRARDILEGRLDKANLELLAQGIKYASAVVEQQDEGADLARHREQAMTILDEQYRIANSIIKSIRSRIKRPELDLPAIQLSAAYIDLIDAQDSVNQAYELLAKNIDLQGKFKVDTVQKGTALKESIEDLAVSRSILLEIELDNVGALRENTSLVPDDKEIKTKLTISTKHLKQLADNFMPLLALMDNLTIDTASYRQQILNATGTISADSAQVGLITGLLVGWGKTTWNFLIEDGPDLLLKVLLFLLIVFVAHKLGNIFKKIVEKAIQSSQLQLSELLRRMVLSIVRNIILIIGLLIALSQVGISLGPLLAGFGIIGFVVGFALQDSLSNFASGLMILMYRPYDVGDLIESGGISGRVSHMSIVNTTILTLDNQTIVVPNSKIWGDVIKNVTAQTQRRVDMVFGISYSDDVAKAERVLEQIVTSHAKVLPEPKPLIKLHELGESSVNFIVKPWVNKDDYWEVYWDITRAVKMKFDEEGLSIPFPQRDVHLYPQVKTES